MPTLIFSMAIVGATTAILARRRRWRRVIDAPVLTPDRLRELGVL